MSDNELMNTNESKREDTCKSANPRRSSYIWMIVSGVLLLALIFVLIKPPFGPSNETVATVNGVEIRKEQLYESMVPIYGPQELENLITQELIKQQAEESDITITDADVDQELNIIKGDYSSDEEFAMVLEQYGMTEEELREEMETQVKLRKLLEPQVDVTEEEVKQYYDENKDSFTEPEQVRASHILLETEEEAQAVLEELKQGGDFAAIAQEKSIDPGSKGQGGDLEFFPRGMMHEEFEEAAFSLEIGEISDIVQTIDGFHIIKATDYKPAVTPAYEDKQEEIRKQLIDNEIYSLASVWIQDIRANADIKTYLMGN